MAKAKHRLGEVKESFFSSDITFRGIKYYYHKIVRGLRKAKQVARELKSMGYNVRLIPIRTIFGATGEFRIYTTPRVKKG